MTAIDATGLHALEKFSDRLRKTGRILLLCGAREQPAKMLKQVGFMRQIGKENILPDVQSALNRARELSTSFEGIGWRSPGTCNARHFRPFSN